MDDQAKKDAPISDPKRPQSLDLSGVFDRQKSVTKSLWNLNTVEEVETPSRIRKQSKINATFNKIVASLSVNPSQPGTPQADPEAQEQTTVTLKKDLPDVTKVERKSTKKKKKKQKPLHGHAKTDESGDSVFLKTGSVFCKFLI